MKRRLVNLFLPVEIVLLIYLLITGILILFYFFRLPEASLHLGIRLGIVLVIMIFAFLEKSNETKKLLRIARLLFPFLLLGFLYKETDYINNLILSHDLDPFFAGIDTGIFGFQPSLIFAQHFSSNLFADLMYFGYFSYYVLVIFVPAWLYFRVSHETGESASFILIGSFLFYYLIFILLPVAGPQFYFTDVQVAVPQGYIFGPVMRFIQHNGEGHTAAFPSSHVSICLMIVWICMKNAKKLQVFVIPVAILLIFSTVYIRAHYVIDIIAGFLCTPPIYLISKKIYSIFNHQMINSNTT